MKVNLNADNRLNLFGICFGLRINAADWLFDGADLFNVFICNCRHKKEGETIKVLFEFKVYRYTHLDKTNCLLTMFNKTWDSDKRI